MKDVIILVQYEKIQEQKRKIHEQKRTIQELQEQLVKTTQTKN